MQTSPVPLGLVKLRKLGKNHKNVHFCTVNLNQLAPMAVSGYARPDKIFQKFWQPKQTYPVPIGLVKLRKLLFAQ
jgi:hypothetical protein